MGWTGCGIVALLLVALLVGGIWMAVNTMGF